MLHNVSRVVTGEPSRNGRGYEEKEEQEEFAANAVRNPMTSLAQDLYHLPIRCPPSPNWKDAMMNCS